MLLPYFRGIQVHATPTEKCNEYLAESNFAESINKLLYFSEACRYSVLAQITRYATAFNLQLL